MKKCVAVVFAVALVVFSPVTIAGLGVDETLGFISSFDGGRAMQGDIVLVVGEPLTENGLSEVPVKIGNAPVYDLLTGFAIDPAVITADIGVRAAYGANPLECGSFPAVTLWLNWDCDQAAAFTVVVSENISWTDEDAVFLSSDGKYRVAFTPDTVIIDPFHGDFHLSDVEPGMEFFLWVDMITASTPAWVYPDKAVLVY